MSIFKDFDAQIGLQPTTLLLTEFHETVKNLVLSSKELFTGCRVDSMYFCKCLRISAFVGCSDFKILLQPSYL